uniref:Chromosome 1 open reading frame 131 n=1 Tax=Chelonoidis abingdonii TaxID=106734 RepID=A0A8C0J764_CHEAB
AGSGENVDPGMERSPGECEQEEEEAARCSLLDAGEPHKKIQKKNVENKMGSEPSRTVMEDRDACPDSAIPGKRKSASRFFEKLKNEMHLDSDSKQATPETRASNAASPESTQQEKTTEVEVVTFHGRNKKKKPKTKMAIPEKNVNGQEFNLEKARLEVHRFGITGYEKKEQRILEQERAIMLGAKPPKKEYLNYKIYQQKIKEKKTVKKEDYSMGQVATSPVA